MKYITILVAGVVASLSVINSTQATYAVIKNNTSQAIELRTPGVGAIVPILPGREYAIHELFDIFFDINTYNRNVKVAIYGKDGALLETKTDIYNPAARQHVYTGYVKTGESKIFYVCNEGAGQCP